MEPTGLRSSGRNVEIHDVPERLTHLGYQCHPFWLVSSWMPGGDLPEYIKRDPDADRLGLVGDPPIMFAVYPTLTSLPAILCRH